MHNNKCQLMILAIIQFSSAIAFGSQSMVDDSLHVSAVSKIPPTGTRYCHSATSAQGPELVDCATTAAISASNKQDGMAEVTTSSFSYNNVGNYKKTACIMDKTTGLMWEGKPATGKTPLEPAKGENGHSYFKYGYWTGNVPSPYTRGNTDAYSYYGDGRPGDAIAYVAEVNSMKLCGFSDWRLPTVNELVGLIDLSKGPPSKKRTEKPPSAGYPFIDQNWFPNTVAGEYLSAEPATQHKMWCVAFDSGQVYKCRREMTRRDLSASGVAPLFVRLVRDTSPSNESMERYRYLKDERGIAGALVKDLQTNLIWRRCTEPLAWNGHHCTGPILIFDYMEALRYSNKIKGWRLPNIKEISSLYEREFNNSHFNTVAFPLNEDEQSHDYWSSTACGSGLANTFAGAWALSAAGESYCDSVSMHFSIRLVHE